MEFALYLGMRTPNAHSPGRLDVLLRLPLPCLAVMAACAVPEPESAPVHDGAPATEAARVALDLPLETTSPPAPMCVDPEEPSEPPLNLKPPEPVMGASFDGQRLSFASRKIDRAKVVWSWGKTEAASASSLERVVGGHTVRVQKSRISGRSDSKRVYLSTGGRALADTELVATYAFTTDAKGQRLAKVESLAVVAAGDTTGAAVDHHSPGGGYAAVPGNCVEEGIVQFGPFPHDMPAVRFPEIRDCSSSRCARLALAWLRLHHNTWRATQMFAFLETKNDAQKSFYWGQPGTDKNGEAVTIKTSPEYWYGPWEKDRYAAAKEAISDLWKIVREAETGGIDVRLVCPDKSKNPGNVCFTTKPLGHHVVKGWINFCDGAFEEGGCNGAVWDTVDETMHHEPLHHVFVNLHGAKSLKDHHSHGHGNVCLSDIKILEPMYCENKVRHLVEYGSCYHSDKAIRTVEAHALFVRTIGKMVDDGDMWNWPKLADPTPQAPNCVGPIGCLCSDTAGWEKPDGDGGPNSYCEDNDGLATCQKTKFNASQNVGICTACDDVRGPGCPCNDLQEPCDVGFCWGDTTGGSASSVGTCWKDPPPSWGCLADCESLLGNGATCMTDHPNGARCVPVGTTLPEASNCWWDGGHMDPQELECTMTPECGPAAPGGVSCADLGYPDYFVCDGSFRCVAQP